MNKKYSIAHTKIFFDFKVGIVGLIIAILLAILPGKVMAAPYDITEYQIPTPDSASTWLNYGPDGNIWFVQRSTDKLATIDRNTGAFTEYDVPDIGSDCGGLTAGPDGNLWFIRGSTNNLSKRDMTTGAITDYAVENESGCLGTPIAGPDGNIWFGTENGFIGKMTTTGEVMKYNIPDQGTGFFLHKGQDNNLWFTDYDQNRIGKITTNGEITMYNPPLGFVTSVVVGPDGNIWFSGNEDNNAIVGVMTPQGEYVTSYIVATGEVISYSLALAGDNRIWVATLGSDHLTAIDVNGNVGTYQIPTSGEWPFILASSSASDIWYTTNSGNLIGRVEMPVVVDPVPTNPPLTTPVANNTTSYLVLPDGITNPVFTTTPDNQITTDPAFSYPAGLVSFQFDTDPGATETVTLYFDLPGSPSSYVARKYNPTTKAFTTIDQATITRETYNNQDLIKLTYPITDGGLLDQDNQVNGTIVDPVGLAQTKTMGPNTGMHTHWLLGVKR